MRALREPQLTNELEVFKEPLAGAVFPEPFSLLFEADPEPQADSQFVRGHADFVADLTRRVVMNADGLSKLLGCKVAPEPAANCQQKLFDFVIRRLFRGRQDADTLAELQQVFDKGQELGGDFQSGARAVLEVALQSPEFLYRVEQGQPAPNHESPWGQPTDLEMASRLSFLFWDRGPDDELLALAQQPGALLDPLMIEKQARRLLADARASGVVGRFYRELMNGRGTPTFDPEVPEFDENVLALMDQELGAFVNHATFDAPHDFASLFAPVTWVNGPLASFYGLPGIEGEVFQHAKLEPGKHAGLLTSPAWLTRASYPRFTNPSGRGWVITSALRCQNVPPHPLAEVPAPTAAGMTSRERAAQHASEVACAGCHSYFDPIGFGLEHFDATGRFRETENGLPIDASGNWPPDGPTFDGAGALATVLLDDPETRGCFASQWVRFAFGHQGEGGNQCTDVTLRKQFETDDNLLELLVNLTQSYAFRFRTQTERQP